MERFGIGQPVRRVEDRRFLTGSGTYVDDLAPAGMAHAVMLRSPHAHARIRRLDASAARAAPGVLLVLTGEDWAAEGLGGIPLRADTRNRDGSPIRHPERPAIVRDRVRCVGDPVALVVAETRAEAKDAVELIEVEYEPLPAVVEARDALAPEAPRVWDDAPDNLCFDWEAGDEAAVDAAFSEAAHVVSLDLVNNRVMATPIEPRGAIAEYDAARDRFTLTSATQNVFQTRRLLAEGVFRMPQEAFHVVARDVGGGFGVKNQVYPEQAAILVAARRLGRPVKWINERSEGFVSDAQGRCQQTRVELALDAEGRFLALRVRTEANMGPYLSTNGPLIPTGATAAVLGGAYRLPAVYLRVRGAFTNAVPTDAYRGAGRPEATYMIERLIDRAAVELGLDRIELRRRNLLRPDELPYTTAMGKTIDCGDFRRVLDAALEAADWNGFAARRAAARARGKLRGLGVASYLEVTLGPPQEYAALRFAPDGGVTLLIGTNSHGQGHETTFAQIIAERLGVPFERIGYRQADSDLIPRGGGYGGSRSLHLGGTALVHAIDAVIEKARRIAAHMLEAAEADIEFGEGRFRVVGTDRAVTITDVIRASFDPANLPEGLEEGLDSEADYEREAHTFPNGCHVAEVEIDPETGVVRVVRHTVVDDFGRIVNPMIVRGQIVGGLAQGLGQALLERVVYDNDGQLLTGSLMDYALPRADDMPDLSIAFIEDIPTATNPLGIKGCGEAGTIASPPAVVNAVVDALAEFGVTHIDMPLTPEKVWRAIRGH